MKKRSWIICFIVCLVIHLTSLVLKIQLWEYISKPVIVLLLVLYFLSQTTTTCSALKKCILGALIFSGMGDVCLLFQQNGPLYFLLGLSAFLTAHVFYILFFNRVKMKEHVSRNFWLFLVAVMYYGGLITFLSPYLGNLKWPVRIYGVIITCMLVLAMHMPFIRDSIAGKYMMAGALLFVISDSVLALNKFYHPFQPADIVIMLTYGLAQLFIVEGAIKYVTSIDQRFAPANRVKS